MSLIVTPDAGAGDGATGDATGDDSQGTITVNTGLAPVLGNVIASVAYGQPFDSDMFVMLLPANGNAALSNTSIWVPIDSATKDGFSIDNIGMALLPSSTYIWYFKADKLPR